MSRRPFGESPGQMQIPGKRIYNYTSQASYGGPVGGCAGIPRRVRPGARLFPLPRRTHQGPKHGFRCSVFAFTSTRTSPSAASLQGEWACAHAGGQAAHPATPSRCQPRCGAGKLDDWLQGGVRYWFRLIRTSISRRGRRIAFPRKARLALFAAQPSEHSTRTSTSYPGLPG